MGDGASITPHCWMATSIHPDEPCSKLMRMSAAQKDLGTARRVVDAAAAARPREGIVEAGNVAIFEGETQRRSRCDTAWPWFRQTPDPWKLCKSAPRIAAGLARELCCILVLVRTTWNQVYPSCSHSLHPKSVEQHVCMCIASTRFVCLQHALVHHTRARRACRFCVVFHTVLLITISISTASQVVGRREKNWIMRVRLASQRHCTASRPEL